MIILTGEDLTHWVDGGSAMFVDGGWCGGADVVAMAFCYRCWVVVMFVTDVYHVLHKRNTMPISSEGDWPIGLLDANARTQGDDTPPCAHWRFARLRWWGVKKNINPTHQVNPHDFGTFAKGKKISQKVAVSNPNLSQPFPYHNLLIL